MNVFQMLALVCSSAVLLSQGAPVNQSTMPCMEKQHQIEEEWEHTANFPSLYFPACEDGGVFWKTTQCTYTDVNNCFCVDPLTGSVIEGSEFRKTSEEEDVTTCAPSVITEGICQGALEKYYDFIEENPSISDSPLGYKPSCEDDDYFEAMQRDENHFFCVDVVTGEVFDETRVEFNTRPISEEICQDYPHSWQAAAIGTTASTSSTSSN